MRFNSQRSTETEIDSARLIPGGEWTAENFAPSKGHGRMDGSVRQFLNMHRTAARWLDDIINAFIERRGTAHVRDIARDLAKSDDARDKDTVEQIVTRRINDFCSDAADFSKDGAHDLFERVEPATYRLRSYPERPDVIELVRIEFDDAAMQSTWDSFKGVARQRHAQQWRDDSILYAG